MSRLFISDLDGTLLDEAARLSARSRDQLTRLLAAGLPFSIASARSIHTIATILGDLPLSLPVIEFNGAFVTDLRTRRSLICHAVEPQIAESVMRWGLAAGIPPFVSTYVDGAQRLYPPSAHPNAGIAWYAESRIEARDERLQPPIDCLRTLEQSIVCVTLIARAAALTPIEAQIHASFPESTNTLCYENRYSPGWHWLTVQSASATKDRALREVAALCGIGAEQVTVFGDEINDVPMFRAAGRGVAVENAIEPLKRIAHEVIGPHHADSVVEYLSRALAAG
jgi:Cof subfamily protein (haloacid dehalogenase superfamily)